MVKNISIGTVGSPSGKIPQVSSQLKYYDTIGAFKARWNINRMNYIVEPGLYAIGNPTPESPVFVSANYKMSFDYLRRELTDIDGWIMVLDTKGINVWCAAGKGTFCTDEIVKRIAETNLEKVVNHRKIIVPQLGAPGVAAHTVKEKTGFNIIYGPVRAKDIKAFLTTGNKTTAEMRKVNFPIYDRLVLIPVELVITLKSLTIIIAISIILSGINKTGYSPDFIAQNGVRAVIFLFSALIAGAVLTPLLLQFIPGTAFSFKGFIISIPFLLSLSYYFSNIGKLEILAWWLIIPAISSYIAMNFTGTTTFTSPSGVQKEMRIALPLQILGFVIGDILWIISRFF